MRLCYMEAYVIVHRPHIKVGKYEVVEEEELPGVRQCLFLDDSFAAFTACCTCWYH